MSEFYSGPGFEREEVRRQLGKQLLMLCTEYLLTMQANALVCFDEYPLEPNQNPLIKEFQKTPGTIVQYDSGPNVFCTIEKHDGYPELTEFSIYYQQKNDDNSVGDRVESYLLHNDGTILAAEELTFMEVDAQYAYNPIDIHPEQFAYRIENEFTPV